MTSLLSHAALGVLTVVLFFNFTSYLYKGGWDGAKVTIAEGACYAIGIASLCTGWYFNYQYMELYGSEASWWHFTKMLFTNPAAGSGSQDLITTNTFLFPLWTIIDGPRRGMKRCWIYFVMSLVTSFGFAMALYIAAQERQVRWNKAHGIKT